jgi:MbtH protein
MSELASESLTQGDRERRTEPARGVTREDRFVVVRNDEEQYSIWLDGDPVPAGWHEEGFTGPKEDCLAHIERVWTDMRPRSLREATRDR